MKAFPLACLCIAALLQVRGEEIDRIDLGDAESERAHSFSDGGASRAESGATGRACRRILKPSAEQWRSQPMKFRLKVAGEGRTYLTVAFWGGDVSHDHVFCTIDGRMLGQMHLGEYDLLDYESCWPRDSNRDTADAEHFGVFTFRTFLLPDGATKGKREIEVAVYAAGHVWGYGENFTQFQKMVTHDSRGIYSFWTHTEPLERCIASFRAGERPPQRRPAAAREPDMDALRAKVDKRLNWLMEPGVLEGRLQEAPLLAEGYNTKGCAAYRNPAAAKAVVAAADAEAWKERREPGSIVSKGTWIGAGRTALAIGRLGADAVAPFLDAKVSGGDTVLARRILWKEHYRKSVEYLATHRKYFANQSQIIDTNAHWCNRALKMCDESAGLPLSTTLGHVKEAMGLKPMPNGYVSISAAGLSKEDGYVGSYGESTIWAAANACEASGGDEELLAQLRKCSRARLFMRYPGVRRDGRRVARLEAQVSWRNEHFPPPPTYLTNTLDIHNAILAKDPVLLGAVRDMYEDGALADYASTAKPEEVATLRFLADWPKVRQAIEKHGDKLPRMPLYGEDFVWCDSENALVVVKRGNDMLFVEAYWRARGSVNGLAKVHFVRPDGEWTATVACEETFRKAGKTERMGDYFQYGWMSRLYDGYRERFGDEAAWPPSNVTAGEIRETGERGGRADFYKVRYGGYSVFINDGDADVRADGIAVKAKNCAVLYNGKPVPAQKGK